MRMQFTPWANYDDELFTLIQRVEGDSLVPYFDSEGIPSIGIGFNMTDGGIQTEVYGQLGFFFDENRTTLSGYGFTEQQINQIIAQEENYRTQIDTAIAQVQTQYAADPPTTTAQREALNTQLRAALDTIMDNRSRDPVYTETVDVNGVPTEIALPAGQLRSTFAFSEGGAGDIEMRTVFDTVLTLPQGFNDIVDAWLAPLIETGESDVSFAANSRERAVLVSLAFNNPDEVLNASVSLREAIHTGNRAEAWYEIRYNTNATS